MSVAYRTTRPHPARPGKGHLHSRVLDTLRRHSAPQPDRSREHPEMLRLDVVSITAAVAGHESGTTWRGEVALSDLRRYLPPGAPMTRERMNGRSTASSAAPRSRTSRALRRSATGCPHSPRAIW
jgi:hypothetical protein